MSGFPTQIRAIPRFERKFFESGEPIMRIGTGEIGGKAHGLAVAHDVLREAFGPADDPGIVVTIPQLAVIATDVFDAFLDRNDLRSLDLAELPDERIAHRFQRASLPTEITGDLMALIEQVHSPLAVRSSSLMEDALFRPFAGVYETKMTPNNQPDSAERFRKLVEAIKYVWSSTYFQAPRNYIRSTGKTIEQEKMAVILQEVVGDRFGDRYYPHISGVCRSYNFFPVGRATPQEGVVNLALGLGKTIVDGGFSWSFSPARPRVPPPFGSVRDQVRNTQIRFWAVNMGEPAAFDPIAETEYLVSLDLTAADYDGTLEHIASTYDAESDALVPDVRTRGPRVVNFAPLLELRRFPINDVVRRMLTACEDGLGFPVEIEFAMTVPRRGATDPPRLGLLQVRPMVVSDARVDLASEEFTAPNVLAASGHVHGNGVNDQISDVIYVKPDAFETRHTREIARQLAGMNADLAKSGRPYLLIGFGRWGSTEPWLGIPVDWGQISGARAIVETTLPDLFVDMSQGSHFYHNLSSCEVFYFMMPHEVERGINWDWLNRQPLVAETSFVRHVRLDAPLLIRVDGRSGRGVIRWSP